MIHAENICLSFGSQKVFDHDSFTLNKNQRIGLVGPNGAGKSTLLKAIVGQTYLDSGSIHCQKNARIAYMPQEVVLSSDKTILDEAFASFAEITALQQELAALEIKLVNGNAEVTDRYTTVVDELALLHPEQALVTTKKVLNGLGFSNEQFATAVTSLSVGWKMRLILAKLLLQKADFYLFDEPTNHLDIVAKDWFLSFLREQECGFLLVCHDRYFLDNACDEILEVEQGSLTFYTGNYTAYREQKQESIRRLQEAISHQQKDIKRKRATIERFRASASKAKMARAMERALDKVTVLTMPPEPKNISFSFASVTRPGKIVLTVDNVGHHFGDKKIFSDVSFEIERGHKVALVAPNGTGKSTLFNLIAGRIPLQQGRIAQGYHVEYALFEQDQNQSLSLENSIFDEVLSKTSHKTPEQIRSFLGAFLFNKEAVQKKIKILSGGEKNRVSMVITLLQDANLLLLDEPTNHLDIQSKEILLKALQDYQGTIFFVSHDHDFINHLATDTIELTKNGAHIFPGNYEEYLFAQRHTTPQTPEPATTTTNPAVSNPGKQQYVDQKEQKKLERKIEKLEKLLETATHQMSGLEYGTPNFNTLQQQITDLQTEIDTLLAQWESLAG